MSTHDDYISPLFVPQTRRSLLKISACHAGWPGLAALGLGQAATRAAETGLHRFPRMVQEYYVEQLKKVETLADKKRAALKNKTAAEAYVQDVRKKIQTCFGPVPEKTDLKPQVVNVVKRDGYNVENVIFESRPGFLVTANFYLPTNQKHLLPAVVGTCGHSTNGKAAGAYQSFAQGLAKLGLACLLYDPIGQGERLQYPDENLKSEIGVGVREHLYAGNQQFLVGDFFGSWRAWDGIRALDYLLTREEIDPKHIGVTGNSGGGTMTTWLCGVEPRWTMGAPSCFVTTFRRNLENELPADTEQCPPKALHLGLDHSDFLAAMAPKPMVIIAQERDFFDVRGAIEAYERLKNLYTLMGAPQNINLHIGPNGHGYHQDGREAMYRCFLRAVGQSDDVKEPDIRLEEDKTLWCTKSGQVSTLNSRPIFLFTKEKSQQLRKNRSPAQNQSMLKRQIMEILKIADATKKNLATPYRILRPRNAFSKLPLPHAANYAVETEPGIHAIVYQLRKDRHYARPKIDNQQPAVLYVSHHSADVELRNEPLIKQMMEKLPTSAWYACDVRGVGESQPDTTSKNAFLTPYGSDYMYSMHAIMLNKPYVGRKTLDLLRVLNWLSKFGHTNVHLVAKGWGTLPATFAAVLDNNVNQVTLKQALRSYSELAESKTYQWPLSCLLPNVLESFDLPDCYDALQKKNLKQITLLGPNDPIT